MACCAPWRTTPVCVGRIKVSPLFITSIVSVILWYAALYWYNSGERPVIDKVIAVSSAFALAGIVLHMLVDRRLWDWTVMAVGIFWLSGGMATLFAYLAWQRLFGDVRDQGVTEAVLDALRDMTIHGAIPVIVMIVLYWYQHVQRRRNRNARPTIERVESALLAERWDGETERRQEYRRVEDRAIRGLE